MTGGARVLLVATLTAPLAASQPAPDASQVLADMRQALGGDALNAVETFSVKGSEERVVGRFTINAKVEWVGILPDRFVEERHPERSITITLGFSGDALVAAVKGRLDGGRGRSQVPAGPVGLTEASRRNLVLLAKRHFSRLTVGMFGITPLYPLEARYVSREMLDGKPVHLLELRGPEDDYAARLCVDVSSHLPRMISWLGRPAMADVSQLLYRSPDTPMEEHRLYFSDYEKSDGLNWPHRFKEVVSKVTVAETRLGKFTINSRIDPNRFGPAR
jgi:hypothetical protein